MTLKEFQLNSHYGFTVCAISTNNNIRVFFVNQKELLHEIHVFNHLISSSSKLCVILG